MLYATPEDLLFSFHPTKSWKMKCIFLINPKEVWVYSEAQGIPQILAF